MGTQQVLLIILGVVIVGVAIVLGIWLFNEASTSSNRDALISDLNNVSSDAFAYYMSARLMGGGNGTYIGYIIPTNFRSNNNGVLTATIAGDGKSITFLATSRDNYGTISVTLDNSGAIGDYVVTGF